VDQAEQEALPFVRKAAAVGSAQQPASISECVPDFDPKIVGPAVTSLVAFPAIAIMGSVRTLSGGARQKKTTPIYDLQTGSQRL
jgi:hypothetical protein